MRMKFERVARRGAESHDDMGRVFVRVVLLENEQARTAAKKGNISRVVTINNAKVGDVFKAIEKALF